MVSSGEENGEKGYNRRALLSEVVSETQSDVGLQRHTDDPLEGCRTIRVGRISKYFSGLAGIAVCDQELS